MNWPLVIVFAAAASAFVAWLALRSPSWLAGEPMAWARLHGRLGALFGVAVGSWGGLVGGVLAPNQVGYAAAMTSGALLLAAGVGALVAGLAHLAGRRPRHIWRTFVHLGALSLLIAFLLPVVHHAYR